MKDKRAIIEGYIERSNGILKLKPAWVTRDFLPPGKRLGLEEKDYYAAIGATFVSGGLHRLPTRKTG